MAPSNTVSPSADADPAPDPFTDELARDIAGVLNRHSIDTAASSPDFILAGMVIENLQSFVKAVTRAQSWRTS